MRFGKLAALMGTLVWALVAISGCSDDTVTSPPPVNYGSLDDPEFVPVKVQVEDAISTIVSDIRAGFGNLYVIPGDTLSVQELLTPPAIEPDPNASPDQLIVIYQNGWHFVYATYTGNTYFSRLRDSIMYQVDGTPVETPSAQVDFVHYINNWTFTALDPAVSHTDYTGRNDFQYQNLDQNVATITGTTSNTVEDVYIGADTAMTNMWNFAFRVTNLRVARGAGRWATGCPQSGRLDMSLSYIYAWENGQTFGSGSAAWTAGITFDDGIATVTVDNGDQIWRYEYDACTNPAN